MIQSLKLKEKTQKVEKVETELLGVKYLSRYKSVNFSPDMSLIITLAKLSKKKKKKNLKWNRYWYLVILDCQVMSSSFQVSYLCISNNSNNNNSNKQRSIVGSLAFR